MVEDPRMNPDWTLDRAKEYLVNKPSSVVHARQARSVPLEERNDRRQKILALKLQTQLPPVVESIGFMTFTLTLTDDQLDQLISSVPDQGRD